MSLFDPETFLSTQTEQGNSTEYILIPEGEYPALIADVKARSQQIKDQGERAILDVFYDVQSPDVAAVTKREKNVARQSIFLDLTPERSLDMGEGMNIELGRLRDAVGQNNPGRPWAPRLLKGNMVRILVKHKADKEDPTKLFANVTKVTKF